MWVSKVNELLGSSSESFEAATKEVIERSNRTLRGVKSIEILQKDASVTNGKIDHYRVRVRLHFDMAPETLWQW